MVLENAEDADLLEGKTHSSTKINDENPYGL